MERQSILEQHADKWIPEPNTGCLIWIAGLGGNPRSLQGTVGWNGKVVRVPRVVCEETNGPPPTSKHHAAHNTRNGCVGGLCVNGGHLRWATARENQQDISAEERSDRIRRGAVNISFEIKQERSRKANLARWSK
jgi:hypothetical protein